MAPDWLLFAQSNSSELSGLSHVAWEMFPFDCLDCKSEYLSQDDMEASINWLGVSFNVFTYGIDFLGQNRIRIHFRIKVRKKGVRKRFNVAVTSFSSDKWKNWLSVYIVWGDKIQQQ